jgi:hypothetical protein
LSAEHAQTDKSAARVMQTKKTTHWRRETIV